MSCSNFVCDGTIITGDEIFEAKGEARTFQQAVHLKQLIHYQVVPANVRTRSRFVEQNLLRQAIEHQLSHADIEYCLTL